MATHHRPPVHPSKQTSAQTVAAGRDNILAETPAKDKDTPRRTTPHKMDQESARLAIVAAWSSWAEINLAGRKAKDNDGHEFLRAVRSAHPELFTFKCSLSPHEIAFSWLLGAGFVAY